MLPLPIIFLPFRLDDGTMKAKVSIKSAPGTGFRGRGRGLLPGTAWPVRGSNPSIFWHYIDVVSLNLANNSGLFEGRAQRILISLKRRRIVMKKWRTETSAAAVL